MLPRVLTLSRMASHHWVSDSPYCYLSEVSLGNEISSHLKYKVKRMRNKQNIVRESKKKYKDIVALFGVPLIPLGSQYNHNRLI